MNVSPLKVDIWIAAHRLLECRVHIRIVLNEETCNGKRERDFG